MQPQQDFAALQQRIETHNDLAEKYAIQVSHLRAGIALEADAWEALLTHLFGHCLVELDGADEFDNETLEAIIDFGFQCMGVGAVVAMNGLAQEDIVI
jgi:hypothetical protein